MRSHIWVPDTQLRAGVPMDHLGWIGEYIVERKPTNLIIGGDWWDMPSLSTYEAPGSLSMEGASYEDDIEAGNHGLDLMMKPIDAEVTRLRRNKKALWDPEKDFLDGNHEQRVIKAINQNPKFGGTIGLHHMRVEQHGFRRHKFLEVIDRDGIWYSHYFYQPMSGKPYGGALATRLKNIGHSFTMGHQQTYDVAMRHLANGQVQRGLVAGACYLHSEHYKGPQANHHWRGIIVKHEVKNGDYSLMEVTLDFLCRKYEGMALEVFMKKKYGEVFPYPVTPARQSR
jgi:hypothetical protein